MTDKELIQELRSKAEVEGAGSTRRLLELAARVLERVQWVSVDERLPMVSGVYLTTDSGICQCLHYSAKYKAFNAFDESKDNEHVLPVECWMPLPEPPEVDK